jgi:hypothetical protein
VVIQKLSCVATRCSTLHPLPDCVWPDASFFLRCGRPSVGLCGWLPKEEESLPILVAEETPFIPPLSLPATRARTHARISLSSLPVVLECKIFKDANHGKPHGTSSQNLIDALQCCCDVMKVSSEGAKPPRSSVVRLSGCKAIFAHAS